MPGLSAGIGGGLRFGGTLGGAPPATIAQTAYGMGSAPVSNPSGVQDWHLGVAVGVAGFVWLAFIRWSLPG